MSKWKAVVGEEVRAWVAVSAYLALFFLAFAAFRNLESSQAGISAVRYGWALVEAVVVGKFILLGRAFHLGRRVANGPLVVPILFETAAYALLVLVLGVLEHVLEGAVRGQGPLASLRELLAQGADELLARTLVLVVALVPMLALSELGKVLGAGNLTRIFLHGPGSSAGQARSAR